MAVRTERIVTQDLSVGMYVSELDRPWIETPFPLQGFHIRNDDDIRQLQAWCQHVYIDRELSTGPLEPVAAPVSRHRVRGAIGKFTPVRYTATQTLKQEVVSATLYHREVTRAVVHLLNDLRAEKGLNLRVARKAAAVMVHSILRNPDAMVWLARLRDRDSYGYAHSIRASILATVFGRHIGLPKDVLENLATGVLLMDIGKTRLPRSMLTSPEPLSPEQWALMREHVQYGVDLLQHSSGVNDQMLAVVQYHHERHDGSGYPFALSGGEIPLLARIAGIVDTYDAVTSERPWAPARTATEAVSVLYELRDTGFQSTLVEQFIQAIGVYPTGTPVELSTGEVGVVVAQNPSRRLRPQVMVVRDRAGQALERPRILDLMNVQQDAEGQPLAVAGCLRAGRVTLDLGNLQINAA
ncbi:HD-GYP domain-containing protein [Isoalcanivorax indicus]|uniref:HD-GYP domain-containing protein n=1 Tax=Isoalcanivorax indicus TaxID=2202653 RepID=UPI000DB9F4CC|nr:HD-GYP domain-containing protein [Isoalcanivorax indicus]